MLLINADSVRGLRLFQSFLSQDTPKDTQDRRRQKCGAMHTSELQLQRRETVGGAGAIGDRGEARRFRPQTPVVVGAPPPHAVPAMVEGVVGVLSGLGVVGAPTPPPCRITTTS